MDNIAVEELFDYVLKDANQRKKQLYADVSNTLLPASVKNSRILADNSKQIFADDPDKDLDHIDVLLGEPEYDEALDDDELLRQDTDYMLDATDEQIDNEQLADRIKNNISQDNMFYGINSTVARPERKTRKQLVQLARENQHKVILDKIISNLLKRSDISDDDKKEALLRILYNNAITSSHSVPADIKLSQRDLRNGLEDAGTYDALNSLEDQRNFLNRQRVLTDQVPISYMSDKTFDKQGKEHSLFTPTTQSNTLYDKFANKFLEDIANGTIQDVYDLSPYVMDIYKDTIRTMPYIDWLKVVDEEAAKINAAKEKRLGRPLTESEKVELDVPEDALTPEDWAEFMPINVKLGKSAAEKADNKLNRQHANNKEDYKRYLSVVAGLRDPDSTDAMLYAMEYGKTPLEEFVENHGRTPDEEMEHIIVDLIIPYCQRNLLKLQEERKIQEDLGNTYTVKKIIREQQYLQDMLDLTDTGVVQLQNFAQRYFSNMLRAEYGISNQKAFTSKKDTMKEMRELQDDPNTPEWAQSFYDKVDDARAQAKEESGKEYNELPDSLKAQLNSFKEL